ncbi:hypothetical protein CMV24_26655 [Pseudomonas plecoglossicida]|uniref:Uncharacterized protein n=2 Tax=Pseudomonas TaxID=286 RepID=A0A2A3LXE9_PSEDL|nr:MULTISPECIES: hypothetical protein [Pseudomonas]HBO8766845.1 hypothetical protein [Pseudomonas aeruginosa]EKT4484146.1 hypothetical protein [Pseudomonas putida]MBA6061792.1 hypothetical protein [Pseudomonas juntendi]PBJ92508.1 hypothetical protein CMV24_26655 [Pseudomonas plecoglossicida]UBM27944.1 hypothetical protein K8374_25920 [Pseudomonas sp. p1(2021b)]
MGNLLDVAPGATGAGTADIAALLLKAAQRYFYLRGPALRTGKANTPMVRIGIDALLSGESLDAEVDRAMIETHAAGLSVPPGASGHAGSHQFSAAEAVFLRKLLAAPQPAQAAQLLKYATAVGVRDTANLFANYIAYMNSPMPWLQQAAIEGPLATFGSSPSNRFENAPTERQRATEGSTPRIWSQAVPESAGHFWNWSGKEGIDASLLVVTWSSDLGKFCVEGAPGTSRPISCEEWGGWWAGLDRPNPAQEIDCLRYAAAG